MHANPKTGREESGGACGGGREREREREREPMHAGVRGDGGGGEREESALAPPFTCFFLRLGLPYANWA